MAMLPLVLAVLAIMPADIAAENFFYLVRQLPATYCSGRRCSVLPESDDFSIHGLWPNYARGGYPENCTDEAYNPSAISDILPQMKQDWESYSEPNNQFWAHEWTCHGTCTKLGQAEFFRTVLSLHEQYNIQAALEQANIVPDSRQEYETSAIVAAIKDAYGVDPVVECSRGDDLLDSIFMCFNQRLEAEDCEDACPSGRCQKSNCDAAVYPPFNSVSAEASIDKEWLERKRGGPECKRGDHGPSMQAS